MFRTAGDVCYTATHRDGTGTVEFFRSDDMYRAVDKLNDSRFRSHTGEEAVIRVTVDRRCVSAFGAVADARVVDRSNKSFD